MLEVQRKVAAGELSSDAMLAFSSLAAKVQRLQPGHQPEHQLLSERTSLARGWSMRAATRSCSASPVEADVQDALLAGLACALCFSGLFSMERRGGMETILCTTPLGRKRTVRAQACGQCGRGGAASRRRPACRI